VLGTSAGNQRCGTRVDLEVEPPGRRRHQRPPASGRASAPSSHGDAAMARRPSAAARRNGSIVGAAAGRARRLCWAGGWSRRASRQVVPRAGSPRAPCTCWRGWCTVASWMARATAVAAEVSCPAMATRCELDHGAAGRGRTTGCGVADRGRMTCHGDTGARSGHGDAIARKKKRRWVRNEDGKVIASSHQAHKRCNRPGSKETKEIRASVEPGFECFKVRAG
jgi:hypothetical protein